MGKLNEYHRKADKYVFYRIEIAVYNRCPNCGRKLKGGELEMSQRGEIVLKDWICKACGEVTPYYEDAKISLGRGKEQR